MMKIINFGVCRHQQRFRQRFDFTMLSLNWSGLEFLTGQYLNLHKGQKCLTLSFPGETVEFEYGLDRENWVAIFDLACLGRDAETGQACWVQGEQRITFPAMVDLAVEQAAVWRDEFSRLYEVFRNPTPANLLRVEWGITGMLRFMLEKKEDASLRSPVARFRHLLSDPQEAHRGLESLSVQCGYSVAHMRGLFKREYGISPQVYRNRHRMTRAMDLIANSRFSLKEIAYQLGFCHPSHFTALFQKTYGTLPREALRSMRLGFSAGAGPVGSVRLS